MIGKRDRVHIGTFLSLTPFDQRGCNNCRFEVMSIRNLGSRFALCVLPTTAYRTRSRIELPPVDAAAIRRIRLAR